MKGRGHGAAQRVAKDRRAADAKLVHIRSSGLKAASTWHRVEILQACRECCGGMGAFTSLCLTWTDLCHTRLTNGHQATCSKACCCRLLAEWRDEIKQFADLRLCSQGEGRRAGFLAANKIGPLKNDMDVDVTFEGANPVMMQQVCSFPAYSSSPSAVFLDGLLQLQPPSRAPKRS